MSPRALLFWASVIAGMGVHPADAAGQASAAGVELVTMPAPDSPLVSVRLMFRAGSIHDPAGKEGLSALTALLVGSSGTAHRTYAELIDALYPMAAAIDVITDREVVVLASQVHREVLDRFTQLLLEAILSPGFRDADFTRHRDQLLAHLTTTLRSANDELLGLEMIQQTIFRGHPYGHAPAGTVDGLATLTLDDARRFYREHYTQATLIVGLGGGYPEGYPASLEERLRALPRGTPVAGPLPPAAEPRGRRFTIVDKRTESTGLHIGYPLPITRADPDFYPLLVANSFLGEHRTFHGRLMQELRGKRGLNYGDYSYIEHWHNPPGTSNPSPNRPRRQQYFSVWIRPVVPENALFALRAAIYEVERLIEDGLTQEQFEITREFLISYSKLWSRSLSDRLGFLMDSRYLGMPPFIDHVEQQLRTTTLEGVNRAIRRYLQTEHFSAVVVTGGAAAFRERLVADAPSPIRYENAVPADVQQADEQIALRPIRAADAVILPIEQTFAGAATPR